ncbi:FBP domain-containing protein [Herbidospora cretacea]|uniref:FBP domain-containing protein n=1 Tax=Herbidospora cretacea TaxID=28444 RepID=UPI0007735657|nr:FBP domain-containing protein [Herbidospora cretacea]
MIPLTPGQIRGSFVNLSRRQAKELSVPPLEEVEWDCLDFFAWRHGRAADRSYLVAEHEGRLVSLALRTTEKKGLTPRSGMCGVCCTVQEGGNFGLFVATRAGASGRAGNSVGIYLCGDLDCSLYVRGIKPRVTRKQMGETLPRRDRVARLQLNLAEFIGKVLEE